MDQREGQKIAPPKLSIIADLGKKAEPNKPAASIFMKESDLQRAPSFSNPKDTEQDNPLESNPSMAIIDKNTLTPAKEMDPELAARFGPSFNTNVLSSLLSKYIQEEEMKEHKLLRPKNYDNFTIEQLNEGKYELADDLGGFSSSLSRSRSPPTKPQDVGKVIKKSDSTGMISSRKKVTPQDFDAYYQKGVKGRQEKKNQWVRAQLEAKMQHEMENVTSKPKISEYPDAHIPKQPFLERQSFYNERRNQELEQLRREAAEKEEERERQRSLSVQSRKRRETQRTESSYLHTENSLYDTSGVKRRTYRGEAGFFGQEAECVFRPTLSSNTQKLSEKLKSETHPEVLERQKILQEKHESELESLRREYAPTFTPTLNPKTLELARNRKSRQASESLNKENKTATDEQPQHKRRLRKRRQKKKDGLVEVNLNTDRSRADDRDSFNEERRFTFSEPTNMEFVSKLKIDDALDVLRETAKVLSKQGLGKIATSSGNLEKKAASRKAPAKEKSFLVTEEDEDAETLQLKSRIEGIQKNLAVFQDSVKRAMREQEELGESFYSLISEDQERSRNSDVRDSHRILQNKPKTNEKVPLFGTRVEGRSSSARPDEEKIGGSYSLRKSLIGKGLRENDASQKRRHTRGSQGNKSQEFVSGRLEDQSDIFTRTLDGRKSRELYEKLAFSTFQEPSKRASGRSSYRESIHGPSKNEDKKGKQRQSTYGRLSYKEESPKKKVEQEPINTMEVIAQLEKLKQTLLKSELEKTQSRGSLKGRMSVIDSKSVNSQQYKSRKSMVPNIPMYNNEKRKSISPESKHSVSPRKSTLQPDTRSGKRGVGKSRMSLREETIPSKKSSRRSVEGKLIRGLSQKARKDVESEYLTTDSGHLATQEAETNESDIIRDRQWTEPDQRVKKSTQRHLSNRMSLREDLSGQKKELSRRSVTGTLPKKRTKLQQEEHSPNEYKAQDNGRRSTRKPVQEAEDIRERFREEKPRKSRKMKKKKPAVGKDSGRLYQSESNGENDNFYVPKNSRTESSENLEDSEAAGKFSEIPEEEDQSFIESIDSLEEEEEERGYYRPNVSKTQTRRSQSRRSDRYQQRIQERVAEVSWSPEKEDRSPREPHDHSKSRIELMTIMLKYLPENLHLDREKLQTFYRNCELLYSERDRDDQTSRSASRGLEKRNNY